MESIPVPEQAKTQRPWAKEVVFGPPTGFQETRGLEDCRNLPVLLDIPEPTPGEEREMPKCHSYWQPTEEEISAMADGQPIRLVVWGTQVPVEVQVGF